MDRKAEGTRLYKKEDYIGARDIWRAVSNDSYSYTMSGARSVRLRAHPKGGVSFINAIFEIRFSIMCNVIQLHLIWLRRGVADKDYDLCERVFKDFIGASKNSLIFGKYPLQMARSDFDRDVTWKAPNNMMAKQLHRMSLANEMMVGLPNDSPRAFRITLLKGL